jgi:hypothetical protein
VFNNFCIFGLNMKRNMKKINILSALLVFFTAISFTSCETEPVGQSVIDDINGGNPNNGNAGGAAVFKVEFGGQTYSATNAAAAVQGTAVNITGLRGTNGEAVSLTIPAGTATGTYTTATMLYNPGTGTAFYSNTNPASPATPTGSVTITNINTTAKTISGTFSFTGYYSDASQNLPAVAFTNGTFQNIPYTGTMPGTNPNPGPGPNPGTQEEYFKAKLAGTLTDFGMVTPITQSGMLMISATDMATGKTVQLTIASNVAQGTYGLGMGIPTAMATTGTTAFSATGGSLTIISNGNGWIKGTFQFTGADMTNPSNTLAVTEGSFNIEL